MVHKALEAAETLAVEGIDVEVVDLVSLAPLDIDTIASSVRRTSRIVVAHEAWKVGGIGAEITAAITEACFFDLEAPPVRVGAPHHPLPMAKPLRDAFVPDVNDLLRAIRQAMAT
jgi:pyruvate dehydrogenase E1 component beta subunit